MHQSLIIVIISPWACQPRSVAILQNDCTRWSGAVRGRPRTGWTCYEATQMLQKVCPYMSELQARRFSFVREPASRSCGGRFRKVRSVRYAVCRSRVLRCWDVAFLAGLRLRVGAAFLSGLRLGVGWLVGRRFGVESFLGYAMGCTIAVAGGICNRDRLSVSIHVWT